MLDALIDDVSRPHALPVAILIARLAGTIVLCSLIGLEREIKKETAGLRTNVLVGLAAATFALISVSILEADFANKQSVAADPLRLVEAVTSGVAFLAAGIIVFARGEVHGLTTGASMWLSASIGLAVGLGFWIIAVLATICGFMVLTIFRRMEVAFGTKDD